MIKNKIIRTSTIAMSLDFLLQGQLFFLNNTYEIVAVSGQDIHLENVAHREGVRTLNVSMKRTIRPLHDLISLWQLYWLFKKEKPQIVHSITPKAGLLSMLAAKMAGVPIRIHTFTGLIFPTKQGILKKTLIAMDRLLCWAATTIIPEGNGVKKDLIDFNITSKPLEVLANGNVNGIDTDYFASEVISTSQKTSLQKKLNIHPTDYVFVFVGRLVGDKGINELVKAFVSIVACEHRKKQDELSYYSNCKLLLVGPFETELDPLLPVTLRMIEENENIISVGFQQDVRPFFAIANALVFPSYREGFPNVVMQAGAMGLPSIVTNINGCNEIIVEGENGLIIPVKNTEAIYNAMQKILIDSVLRKRLQENARPLIVSRYEQRVVWEAVLKKYNNLEKNV